MVSKYEVYMNLMSEANIFFIWGKVTYLNNTYSTKVWTRKRKQICQKSRLNTRYSILEGAWCQVKNTHACRRRRTYHSVSLIQRLTRFTTLFPHLLHILRWKYLNVPDIIHKCPALRTEFVSGTELEISFNNILQMKTYVLTLLCKGKIIGS